MSVAYEVHVDWDATNWRATPDFSEGIDDITNYVKGPFRVDRGKKVELGNSPAGILEITLDNSDKRFSPPYAASPLFGKMRPWLPIRIQGTVSGGGALVFYTGFISRIRVDPHEDVQEVYLYCTDGLDLLARNMISLKKSERLVVSDGNAIGSLLDGAGWPADKRNLDEDTGQVINYPRVVEY